jgi:hypothetical protein
MAKKSMNEVLTFLENLLLTLSSQFYLATQIKEAKFQYKGKTVTLDPLIYADGFELGKWKIMGVALEITLSNVTIKGLSNVSIIKDGKTPEISVDGNTVTFHAELPNRDKGYTRPADVPAQLEMSADFIATLDQQAMPKGTINATIKSIKDLTGVFASSWASEGEFSTLALSFSELAATIDETSDNMNIVVDIDTSFKPTINAMVNRPDTYKKIVDTLNAELQKPLILQAISNQTTLAARKALGNF